MNTSPRQLAHLRGFTLIELSIALVIIGLLTGGVLVGRDLIDAATIKGQTTQIERYVIASTTFKDKYGGLPGDLGLSLAMKFGFNTTNCTGSTGYRNGDDNIQGRQYPYDLIQGVGETGLFWSDLSKAHFIENQFSSADCSSTPTITTGFNLYFPKAMTGDTNYINVFCVPCGPNPVTSMSGGNWLNISNIFWLALSVQYSQSVIPVKLAYKIDSKIDDGIPLTGTVQASYLTFDSGGSGGGVVAQDAGVSKCADITTSINGVYDTASKVYCSLSFKMK